MSDFNRPSPWLFLLERTEALVQALRESPTAGDRSLTERLQASVIRPLRAELGPPADGAEGSVDPTADNLERAASLRAMALEATALRARPGVSSRAIEATAALQQLAVHAADDAPAQESLREHLRALQRDLPSAILSGTDGPYLVTNVEELFDWLGVQMAWLPQMALCRCGASKSKPFCDGAHAEIGFSGAKSPDRVPDRLDTYAGPPVAIHDNRGLCAHSGFCTDRLKSVFHIEGEPFVTPGSAQMDQIVLAIRGCPSGALSYSLESPEAPPSEDQRRTPTIEISKDGPYRVTGGITLQNGVGNVEPRNVGASLEHYSLCRCGQSRNKPFCSGRHWEVRFNDPPLRTEGDPTLFEWMGGLPALTRMTRIFYSKYVPQDPLLAPLFANMSPDHPERVAAWLVETFGGPKLYTARHGGYDHMVSQHVNKAITEAQRARWAQGMYQAADDAGLPADPEFRAAFAAYIEWGSRIALENSQPGAKPPPHMPVPKWWWVCNATPGARRSALATQAEAEPIIPALGEHETPSFAKHIRPLFRKMDRDSMKFVFDLWSLDDVAKHAAAIWQRLEAGTMPCDGAWPAEKRKIFQRWMESGAGA